jgi:hypothetical protein
MLACPEESAFAALVDRHGMDTIKSTTKENASIRALLQELEGNS